MDLGFSAEMPNYNYECTCPGVVGGGIVDAAVDFCISDLLTNPIYGAQFAGTLDISLTTLARSYWAANNFFISPLLDSARTAADIVSEWCEAGNVGVYWSEGLMKFIPYGDTTQVANGYTYTPQTHPVVDLNDDDFLSDGSGGDPVTVERTPWQDAYNDVKVQFENRINNYNPDVVEERDAYAISQYGLRAEGQKDYSFIKTAPAAIFAANIRLKRLVYIRAQYHFSISAVRFSFLEPMDIVTLTDLTMGLNFTPVRITTIEEDDQGVMQVTAEEFPWGTATATLFPKQPVQPYQPIAQQTDPGNTTPYIFETTPQHMLGAQNTIFIACAGANINWGGCHIWLSFDGTNYGSNPIGKVDGSHRMGVLTTTLPFHADPDTTDTLGVDMSLSAAVLQSVSLAAADNFATLCSIINSLGQTELISFENATLTAQNQYNLTYIRRGIYGSAIVNHAIGDRFTRMDNDLFSYQYPANYVGRTIYLKFTSYNIFGSAEQDISTVTAYPYVVGGGTVGAPGQGPFTVTPPNPLTAQAIAGGSTAQIMVAPFAAGFNNLSVNCIPSGFTISGVTQGQSYAVYYIDLAFAGGNITPIATQNSADYTGKPGYYLLGVIITPSIGTLYRPSTFSDIGQSTTSNPTFAFDASPSSAAQVNGVWNSGLGLQADGDCIFSGFPSLTLGGALALKVTTASIVFQPSAVGLAKIVATIGGASTTLVSVTTSTAGTTYTLAVPGGTNISTVTVEATASQTGGPSNTVRVNITDIQIS
jgi:hypothetical protein